MDMMDPEKMRNQDSVNCMNESVLGLVLSWDEFQSSESKEFMSDVLRGMINELSRHFYVQNALSNPTTIYNFLDTFRDFFLYMALDCIDRELNVGKQDKQTNYKNVCETLRKCSSVLYNYPRTDGDGETYKAIITLLDYYFLTIVPDCQINDSDSVFRFKSSGLKFHVLVPVKIALWVQIIVFTHAEGKLLVDELCKDEVFSTLFLDGDCVYWAFRHLWESYCNKDSWLINLKNKDDTYDDKDDEEILTSLKRLIDTMPFIKKIAQSSIRLYQPYVHSGASIAELSGECDFYFSPHRFGNSRYEIATLFSGIKMCVALSWAAKKDEHNICATENNIRINANSAESFIYFFDCVLGVKHCADLTEGALYYGQQHIMLDVLFDPKLQCMNLFNDLLHHTKVYDDLTELLKAILDSDLQEFLDSDLYHINRLNSYLKDTPFDPDYSFLYSKDKISSKCFNQLLVLHGFASLISPKGERVLNDDHYAVIDNALKQQVSLRKGSVESSDIIDLEYFKKESEAIKEMNAYNEEGKKNDVFGLSLSIMSIQSVGTYASSMDSQL